MKYFVTGGAGFVGSNLVEKLVERGEVIVYDNLSQGKKEFILPLIKNKKIKFVNADILEKDRLIIEMGGCDVVFHLAANSDIREGTLSTNIDLKNGTIGTYNVLESMRLNNVKKIVFSSSSVVYGEAKKLPIPESYGPCLPISLYGASKLAAEGLISSFCHSYNMQAWIYRFANIVGKNGTHGVIVDFINKLKKNPKELEILGDGQQRKPYLLVDDCVDGMLYGFDHAFKQVNYFNLGCEGNTQVIDIAKIIIKKLDIKNVKLKFTGGKRGWIGDVPLVALDVTKINKMGWHARYSSNQAVKQATTILINST